jgi:hypothetical protein
MEEASRDGDPLGPLPALAAACSIDADDLEAPLFLDTETTGLSGGTGTVAFMIGLAWLEADGVRVAQYFLADFQQERAVLWAVGDRLRRHRLVVTYNGRTFDWPLLQTRLILTRTHPPWPSLPHLDLLRLARRLFRPRVPDCRLRTVEVSVLALERDEDLPGDAIPGRYFAWLRGATPSFLEPVFAHNRQDVLSMVDLVRRLERILESPDGLSQLDRFSRARFLEVCGRSEEALAEYRALWQTFPGPLRGALGLRLARLLCRSGQWREARGVLEACWAAQAYPYPAALELAKLLEHRARDLPAALRLVADALRLHRLAGIADQRWADDLERRRIRLERRLGHGAHDAPSAGELPWLATASR